jgi:hypothetical protein
MVALIAGAGAYPYLLWPPDKLVQFGTLMDDAWFYSVVARNSLELGWLSLDGSMSTNGVQPLWFLLQLGLHWLFPNIEGTVLIARATWVCFVVFAGLVAFYLNRKPSPPSAIAAAIVCAVLFVLPGFASSVLRGLETPLMLLVLMGWLLTLDRLLSSTARKDDGLINVALLAILSALLFLARTDLFWAAVVTAVWLFALDRRLSVRVWLFSGTVAILVIPYLLYNIWAEGALMPISGRVKLFYMGQVFPTIAAYLSSHEWQGPYHLFDQSFGLHLLPLPIAVRYALAMLMLLSCWVFVWFKRHDPTLPNSLRLLALVTLGHMLFMHFAYGELRPYTSYYFAPEVLFVALVIGAALNSALGKRTRWLQLANATVTARGQNTAFALVLSVLLLSAIGMRDHILAPRVKWEQRLQLALDIGRLVPDGQSVAAFWPGLFAEFSGKPVTPLDGIIGSNRYFHDYVKTAREIDYMREHGIHYLAIKLNESPSAFLRGEKPNVTNWASLGQLRLWHARRHVVGVVSARPTKSNGAGWYLIELRFGV